MKIGEVAVISHDQQSRDNFIQAICKHIDIRNESISFGRFDVNDQLALHLYGINIDKENSDLSWDLISRKMLGYVFIFNWDDQISLETIKPVIDNFTNSIKAPFVIIANTKDSQNAPIPNAFYKDKGLILAKNCRFTFSQLNDTRKVRDVLLLLVDMLLEQVYPE